CYRCALPSRLDSLHSRSESMRRFVVSIATFIALSLASLAQDNSTGAIRGFVADPGGNRIVGASVALVNNATGVHYEQASEVTGHFAFELLPPGAYSALVTAEGMSPQLSPDIRVTIGEVSEMTFKLALAGTHESVTVSAEPKAVETQPHGLSAVTDERA